MLEVSVGEIQRGDVQLGPVVFHRGQEAPRSGCDVEQGLRALVPALHVLRDGHQCLAPHGISGAAEERLNLEVVSLCGVFRQPSAGLEMEVLHVIVRHALARLFGLHFVVDVVAAAAGDFGHVAQEVDGVAQRGYGGAIEGRRRGVKAVLNVLPVALEKLLHLAEEELAVRVATSHPDAFFREGGFSSEAICQKVVPAEPGHAGRLAQAVQCASQWVCHARFTCVRTGP